MVLAGALFGFFPTILNALYSPWSLVDCIVLVSIIFVGLLYGTGVLQNYFHNRRLNDRWKKPLLVGILNVIPWDLANDQTYSWTDVNPKDWEKQLEFYAKERGLIGT